MIVSEGKQLISDELSEKLVTYAHNNNLTLRQAYIKLEYSYKPRTSNALCFMYSMWSKFTKEELRAFFPPTLKDD